MKELDFIKWLDDIDLISGLRNQESSNVIKIDENYFAFKNMSDVYDIYTNHISGSVQCDKISN